MPWSQRSSASSRRVKFSSMSRVSKFTVHPTDRCTEKTTQSGRRRTKTAAKNLRYAWAASTSLLRYGIRSLFNCTVLTSIDRKNWLATGRARLFRSGRPPCFLLSRPGPQGTSLLVDLAALQGNIIMPKWFVLLLTCLQIKPI